MKSLEFRVQGRVQGVGFCWACRTKAGQLGLKGQVQNRDDGSVTGIVQGPDTLVGDFLDWLGAGPPGSLVIYRIPPGFLQLFCIPSRRRQYTRIIPRR